MELFLKPFGHNSQQLNFVLQEENIKITKERKLDQTVAFERSCNLNVQVLHKLNSIKSNCMLGGESESDD